MASTSSRPDNEAVSAPPVFSYAQAAKGRAAATTASAISSHQSIASGTSTPGKDTPSAVNTPVGGSERDEKSVNGSIEVVSKPEKSAPAEIAVPEWRTSAAPKSTSIPTSPSFGTASTSTLPKEDKEDDFILVGVTASEARERNADRGDTDGRRGKKTKKEKRTERESEKEKEKEKEKEEVKPEILVPAPIPTVNFWSQRKEEFAKVRPTPIVGQILFESSNANDTASASKAVDAKKGVKDVNKSAGNAPNGTVKASPSSKGQRKIEEGQNKPREDQAGKRAAPRGSRIGEQEDKVTGTQLPPPVEDAMSWPTPETALEEEKRKLQEKLEKEEKEDAASNRPRPKEKWVTVPYTPSVTFNTPIPTRGGRGRGGARGGRTEAGGRAGQLGNGVAVGDKHGAPMTNGILQESEPQTGKEVPRSNSLPPPKRQASDQSGPRRPSNVQVTEKPKTSPSKGESSSFGDIRHAPGLHTEQTSEGVQEHYVRGSRNEQNQSKDNQHYTPSRSSTDIRATESFKEGNHQSRDRNEGRAERGRGGFRGRGNHAGYPNGQPHPQNLFANGHGPLQQNGFPTRQSNGPYSPPIQPPFNNQYTLTPSRNGRGGTRAQSIPNGNMYGGPRYAPNGGPVMGHMAPLQTSNTMYDYQQPMQPLGSQPYNPYIDHTSVLALVTMQLEYYFSIDNLCKDVYLRKHMDSQGFVFLNFIAGFKRIQALTQELDLLRQACQDSAIIELIRGSDGLDRLRRVEGADKWVLALGERDESVRNDGPAYYNHPSPIAQRSQNILANQHPLSPTTFTQNGATPYTNGVGMHVSSAQYNGNGNNYASDTPLSAAVIDFTPGQIPLNGAPDLLEAETTFSDDEVSHLTLVFLPKGNKDGSKPKSPFHGSSRTFSNGSIDGRSIAEELFDDLRQGRAQTNGSHGDT